MRWQGGSRCPACSRASARSSGRSRTCCCRRGGCTQPRRWWPRLPPERERKLWPAWRSPSLARSLALSAARVLLGLGDGLGLAQPAALARPDQASNPLALLGAKAGIGAAGLEGRRRALGLPLAGERLLRAGHELGLGGHAPAAVGFAGEPARRRREDRELERRA